VKNIGEVDLWGDGARLRGLVVKQNTGSGNVLGRKRVRSLNKQSE
jgi:hypothetical protein